MDRNKPGKIEKSEGMEVALRKESVDRNAKLNDEVAEEWRRSPQGERG